jgi:AcrR family transcriptional regulator
LAKAKRTLKWQRDPEGMRLRILEAAKQEFAAHGLAGARVDRIAAEAGANKRMLYYHVGNKEDLYLAVLEGAYERAGSRASRSAAGDRNADRLYLELLYP